MLVGEFKCKDDEMTLELLSIIAMQLSQQQRTPKMVLEAFKVISYLIFDLQQRQVIADTTDIIARSVSMAMKRIHDKLVEATEQLVSAAVESNKAGEQLQIGCQEAIAKLKLATEGTYRMREEDNTYGNERLREDRAEEMGEMMKTYADRVKKKVPAEHALAVAKATNQQKKIRLIKALGMAGEGLNALSEKQLVEKANLALALMEAGTEDKPEEVKVIGANKERIGRGNI